MAAKKRAKQKVLTIDDVVWAVSELNRRSQACLRVLRPVGKTRITVRESRLVVQRLGATLQPKKGGC